MGATTVLVTSGMENDHQKLYYNRPHLVADTLEDLVSTDVTHFSFVDIVTRQALNIQNDSLCDVTFAFSAYLDFQRHRFEKHRVYLLGSTKYHDQSTCSKKLSYVEDTWR